MESSSSCVRIRKFLSWSRINSLLNFHKLIQNHLQTASIISASSVSSSGGILSSGYSSSWPYRTCIFALSGVSVAVLGIMAIRAIMAMIPVGIGALVGAGLLGAGLSIL